MKNEVGALFEIRERNGSGWWLIADGRHPSRFAGEKQWAL